VRYRAAQRDPIYQRRGRLRSVHAEYFVLVEIVVFLTPDLPREDLWQEVGNRMSRVLAGSPRP
jgi:hypothetical protein